MGQLIDGKWRTENILFNHDATGLYFKRDSVFRHRISNESGAEFPRRGRPVSSLLRGRLPVGAPRHADAHAEKARTVRDADQRVSGG